MEHANLPLFCEEDSHESFEAPWHGRGFRGRARGILPRHCTAPCAMGRGIPIFELQTLPYTAQRGDFTMSAVLGEGSKSQVMEYTMRNIVENHMQNIRGRA
ncbi:hypothetical protein [Rhodovarius sp.]|uniref:hypothetical protein n=1 Tax=Rhodovarius sp. TaxID=2972673 RepID=UPI00333E85C4